MQNQEIPQVVLKKWADSLYALGKGAEAPSLKEVTQNITDISRDIYKLLETDTGTSIHVSTNFLLKLRNDIHWLSTNKSLDKIMTSSLLHIDRSIEKFLMDRPQKDQLHLKAGTQMIHNLLWRSILLGFTLWYGGQSFSITKKELDLELGLARNLQLKRAYEVMFKRSIFLEKGSGLLVLNPRFKTEVDMAALFLLSIGRNLMFQLNYSKRYSTIQAGFLKFSGSNHHPMVSLGENVRSYVSDYCQRTFGKLFERLREKKMEPDYSNLRRFLTRLSLYPSSDFVVSADLEIKKLIGELKNLGVITQPSSLEGEKFILLEKAVM